MDLDGSLVQSDMLIESLFMFIRMHPLRIFQLFVWVLRGKAYFKRRIADSVAPDASTLPYNQPLLRWLESQRAGGAALVLATASDRRIARDVAEHLQIFDEVLGTEDRNLASRNKRDVLVARYGRLGFEYVGNSRADLAVWEAASLAHVANPDRGVLAAATKFGRMGQLFDERAGQLGVLRRALRMHQWAKNLLVFVPLLAAHRLMELPVLLNGLLAFLCFGACASSVYLLNDMFDLADDRKHRTKCHRPLASGALSVFHAMLWIPALLVVAFTVALLWLPPMFSAVLFGYYVLTLAYSMWLKRVVMLDVVILAMLYTVRVIAGAAAISHAPTFWILAFCIFIFLSLAFVKRYTELYDAKDRGGSAKAPGRGYLPSDFELLASLGGSAGYLSVLVLALYVNDAAAQILYRHPHWMWMACPLLLFWLSRVWLIAHRGQMHDDPIVFALRDRVSRWVGVAFVMVFILAAI